jgi:hypothetical protein
MDTEGKAVAKWDEELAKHAKAEAAKERPQLARISLRGGVMTYMDQKVKDNKLPVVVIATMVENAYYKGKFNPNKPEAPDCFAFSEDGEDMVPHEKSFDQQSRTCDTCPQNQWGSDANSPSGKGKACKQKRKLLVMPASALNEDVTKAELAIIDIPVMSVKNWSNYVNAVASQHERPSWGVATEISVHADPKAQFIVKFNYLFDVGTEHLQGIYDRAQQTRELLAIPYEKTAEGLSPTTEAMQTGKKY